MQIITRVANKYKEEEEERRSDDDETTATTLFPLLTSATGPSQLVPLSRLSLMRGDMGQELSLC